MIKTVSSRDFNHDLSKIKRDAKNGPVFITDRGKPRHVLLSIEDYEQLIDKKENIVDLLAMPSADAIDFDIQNISSNLFNIKDID